MLWSLISFKDLNNKVKPTVYLLPIWYCITLVILSKKRLASGLKLSRVSSRRNFPMSRSRLGLEAERLGSRLGLGHEGLVSIPAVWAEQSAMCRLNAVWKYGIMKDLHNTGLRGRLPCFIEGFLRSRNFAFVSVHAFLIYMNKKWVFPKEVYYRSLCLV